MDEVLFLRNIVDGLVSNRGGVFIEGVADERGTLLTLKVDAVDMGKVIGFQGQNVTAMRTLLRAFGKMQGKHINIKVVEPEGGRRQKQSDKELVGE